MSSNCITILHDSFGRRGDLRKDWGFAALVEFGGRRILFDAGHDARTFAENTGSLGVDLRSLDFSVISHRHGDHTTGLEHLLRVNPTIAVYTPDETYGAPFIRAAQRFPYTCSTTTATHRKQSATGPHGPVRGSSGSKRQPNSSRMCGWSRWSLTCPALVRCGSYRWHYAHRMD